MFGANSTSERDRSWVPGTPTPTSLTSGCNFSRILMVLMMESRTLRQPSLGVGIVVLLRNSFSFNAPHAILVAPISTPIVALIHLLRTVLSGEAAARRCNEPGQKPGERCRLYSRVSQCDVN